MSDGKHPVLTGGCQCGAIRYAITAPPEHVHLCHLPRLSEGGGRPVCRARAGTT